MAPLIKLAVVSITDQEASLLGKKAYLSSFLLQCGEKQPYLVSTSPYKLSVKALFYSSHMSNSNGGYKIT